MKTITQRMERVLSRTFGGLHNCPKIGKENEGNDWEMWEVNVLGDMATFDADQLTLLVIAAHDECIRASICSAGPRRLKIRLWPRKREGGFNERHPTIEKVLEKIRKSEQPDQ